MAAPLPAPTHSLALTPQVPHLKHRDGPQGLVAPQVPDNADLVPARAGGKQPPQFPTLSHGPPCLLGPG